MMSQITPKHILGNQILLKLSKIFNSTEINLNRTYPLSEPSVPWGSENYVCLFFEWSKGVYLKNGPVFIWKVPTIHKPEIFN